MAESLIVEPINFNIICILLDYNFRQVLIRVAFKLCHQLFVKHRAGCAAKSLELRLVFFVDIKTSGNHFDYNFRRKQRVAMLCILEKSVDVRIK